MIVDKSTTFDDFSICLTKPLSVIILRSAVQYGSGITDYSLAGSVLWLLKSRWSWHNDSPLEEESIMRTHSLACRLTALVMSLLLAFSFGAVAAAEGSFTAGTYTGTAKGFGGDVTVTVEVPTAPSSPWKPSAKARRTASAPTLLRCCPLRLVSAQSLKVDTVAAAP